VVWPSKWQHRNIRGIHVKGKMICTYDVDCLPSKTENDKKNRKKKGR
jgi:hypothetical protein